MRSFKGLLRLLAVLTAAAIFAAACGSDDTADESADGTVTESDSATADETGDDAGEDTDDDTADDSGADEGAAADEEAAASDDPRQVTIGFSVQSISRTFFSGMLAGIEGSEAELEEKYGVNITLLTTTAQDEASIQDENTSDLIAAGVDGVLFSPVNSGAATAMVDRLVEAGVPVVAVANQIGSVEEYGRNSIYEGTVGYVTNDDIAMGARAAEAADELATELGRTANIFILQGTNGAANVPLRQGGFEEKLAELGTDWNLLDARPGDFSNVVSEEACQNALQAYDNIDIIYSMSDEMTSGCVRAIDAAGRDDVQIASIGGNAKGIALIEEGKFKSTVCQKPGTMGATALDVLLDFIVNGNERGLEFYDTPVVTVDNLDECVPQW
jgi:ribose transport system substrate-binding protein